MDDETRAYLDAIKAELMTQMNNQHERILDEISALRADFQRDWLKRHGNRSK